MPFVIQSGKIRSKQTGHRWLYKDAQESWIRMSDN